MRSATSANLASTKAGNNNLDAGNTGNHCPRRSSPSFPGRSVQAKFAVDSDFMYSLHPHYYFLRVPCVLLFMLFMVFVFTERPGRLGLLRRGQWFLVFPASRFLFPVFAYVFYGVHDFRLYGAAWAPWVASPWTVISCIPCIQIIISCFLFMFSYFPGCHDFCL